MTALLGVDYGTTGFKVRLFDARGQVLGDGAGQVPVQCPAPGWIEQEVHSGWAGICLAIRASLQKSGVRPSEVVAVSATGTQNLSILDEVGSVLRPAILYGDARLPPRPDIERMLDEIGEARLGAPFGFARLDEGKLAIVLRILRSTKLLWLRAHEPEAYARIHACLATSMDFVITRLIGSPVHLAGGLPVDDAIAELFDIPRRWFGTPCRTGEVAGHITAEAAAETGLAEGTPVVMAAGDSLCAFLGAGLVQPRVALNLAGTTDVVGVVAGERPITSVGYPIPHLIPDRWLVALSPLRGPAMQWLRDTVLPQGGSFADIDALAEQAPAGARGLLCLPYFAGEKGVVHDPQARGVLIGLDARHDRGHVARAVLEGIAYGLRDILEAYLTAGYPVNELRLAGGGARSRLWNQIKADVLERPVNVMQVAECGCLGAAILAAVAIGLYRNRVTAAAEMSRVAETLQPEPACALVYRRSYELYRQVYPANREIFATLAGMASAAAG
jgi:xylulokinase